MNTENPLFFIFDVMKQFVLLLDSYKAFGVSLYMWILSFIIVGMVVSIFWRGARG